MMVARAAQTIASKCDIDSEKAFIYGEMHDIGKFFLSQEEVYKHPRLGYDMLINEYPDIARVCILHSFASTDFSQIVNFCHKDTVEANKIYSIIKKIKIDSYIELIQLCDKISAIDSYITIEQKLMWYQDKHHISYSDLDKYYKIPLNNTKTKFDSLTGINIYKLLNV